MERICTLKYGSVIFNAQTTNSARAREVFKTDHILKLEGCKKSTSRPGQSAEVVRASALQKKKKNTTGRRHVATKSQRQKGKSITCSSRRGKRRRRRPARKPAGEVRAAGPLRCRGSAAPGGDAARWRRTDGQPSGPQDTAAAGRPAQPVRSPPLLSGRRTPREHPGPGRGAGGRGGALTSPPLPRGLREGEREGGAPREAAIRRSSRPQLPNSAARLPGQVLTNLVSPRPSRTRLLFRCSSFFPQDGKPPEMRPPGRRGRIAPSLGTW